MLGTETSLKALTSATRTGPASFSTSSKAGKNTAPRTVAGAIAEYKRQHCAAMGIGIGPRLHSECPFGVTFDPSREVNPLGVTFVLLRLVQVLVRRVWFAQR